ncbi:hypothetical protein PYW08_002319 [Mythimna loreyi]|uniref:Uncharacterized protein n=1 Tax=Mythimna loreyi TaxID=667449 RepID=A0ACC2R1E2_9NEOP|nr:hypothetical protein PYW08_002319 [Mythimna loreyi]
MFCRTILLLLLLWTPGLVRSLRLVQLRVPSYKREGGKAMLSCQYDLQGDTLYSVKWFKDNLEFFRYVPSNQPSLQTFRMRGVKVDIARSTGNTVALVDLAHESSGNYSCEVNGDAPRFETKTAYKYLDVYLLPKTGPSVVGLKNQYNFGNLVAANCSLPPSHPQSLLIWFINGRVAPDSYVSGPWYRVSADRPDASETILQLSFHASEAEFIDGTVKIKCQATIAPLYYKVKESTHYIKPSTEEKGIERR